MTHLVGLCPVGPLPDPAAGEAGLDRVPAEPHQGGPHPVPVRAGGGQGLRGRRRQHHLQLVPAVPVVSDRSTCGMKRDLEHFVTSAMISKWLFTGKLRDRMLLSYW